MHDAARDVIIAADRPAVHPGLDPAGQLDGHRAGLLAGQHLSRLAEQHALVARVEDLAGVLVHHDDVVVQGQHDPAGAPAGPHVLLHELEFPRAAVGQHGLGDLVRGGLGQRDQQRVGVPAPAGQVDRADGLPGDRIVDRHPGAGQVLEVFGVVLVPEHGGGLAAFQRGADPVGADVLLGVAEARRELDPVQVTFQVVVGGHPGEHDARGVGEDDADRLPLQVLAEVAQHGHGVAGQRSIKIRVPDVRQRYPVGGYLPLPGAPPGRQDRLTYLARPDRLGRQETLPRLGQPLAVGRGWQVHCCGHHRASVPPGTPAQALSSRSRIPGSRLTYPK